jgi:hypothetical protein
MQDRVLERPQLRARLDAEVARELLACVLVGVERLRLAPAAVEREHQLGDEPLAGRMLGDEPAQLRDELGVTAGSGIGLDARLQRGELLLLEPRDLGRRERLVGEVGERGAAPHLLRFAQDRRGFLRLPRGQRPAAALHEVIEAVGVELAALDAQPVAGRGRRQDALPERLAQPGDVDLDLLGRTRRCVLAEQRDREPLGAYRLVRMQQEDGEDGARLRTPERNDTVLVAYFKWTKDPEVHRPRRNATCDEDLRIPLLSLAGRLSPSAGSPWTEWPLERRPRDAADLDVLDGTSIVDDDEAVEDLRRKSTGGAACQLDVHCCQERARRRADTGPGMLSACV